MDTTRSCCGPLRAAKPQCMPLCTPKASLHPAELPAHSPPCSSQRALAGGQLLPPQEHRSFFFSPPKTLTSFKPAQLVGSRVPSSTHGSSEGWVQWGTLRLLVLGYSARGYCWSPCFTLTLSPTGPTPQHPPGDPGVRPTAPHGLAWSCGSHKPGSPAVSGAPLRCSVSG